MVVALPVPQGIPKRLTVKGIEAIEAGEKRREVPDSLMQGLYLIVQPSTGNKAWAVRCRQNGRPRKFTIGRYPVYGLAEAREAAARILRSVSEGRDPLRSNAGTVDDTASRFLERYGRRRYRPSTLRDCTRTLDRAVAAWRGRKLDSITKADVRDLLDSITAPAASNQALKFLKRLFSWAVSEDLLKASPLVGFGKPHLEQSRERILADDELREVWQAADAAGYAFGDFVKMAILTGQRPGEVSGMRRDELHGDTWILPSERVKNKKSHSVPLSRQAMGIIEAAHQISEEYVFSYGTKPLRGFHHAKHALDQASGVNGWTLHDLRRTCASGLARLGVSIAVIEQILNHRGGSLAGVAGVYIRHQFEKEKRAALQQWADHVEQLVKCRE
jgi:integrase